MYEMQIISLKVSLVKHTNSSHSHLVTTKTKGGIMINHNIISVTSNLYLVLYLGIKPEKCQFKMLNFLIHLALNTLEKVILLENIHITVNSLYVLTFFHSLLI